ncbi:MAG: tRNA guanosine(34) transglycosylase Tgt, partial [Bradyrhizobium sp.]|uniref:tRNA guanosine(34) transglycosylase Tgt n=1 Tax=Bradyrhizobium sp. TaxID=376 RepID=UPI001D720549
FAVHATDGRARAGLIETRRGAIRTPAFMPVGTAATVKALRPAEVRAAGADVILGNTYHLMLRPGPERVKRLGGLHRFMRWDGPILTDSGGFQVMSLAKISKVKEEGVTFQSHIDGSRHALSPERSIEIQADLLGADIAMQLDECVSWPAEEGRAREAMQLSLRWAERCKAAFGQREGQALFGIQQGSTFEHLRRESAERLIEIGFDGYAIGGLAVGEPQETMLRVVEETTALLPADKPRYLMGVGTPEDILEAVARGVDMFDCVMPTRNGRHGVAFTRYGPVNLKNARHAEDPRPLDPDAGDRGYSRAYLHHLVKANEMLGAILLSQANICYYQALMQGIRAAIAAGEFEDFRRTTQEDWSRGDIAPIGTPVSAP